MAAYKDEARGTWYVSFHYNDWTGKNKRKLKRGFRTRKEALEYEQKFLLQQATNLDMRFEDFYKLYEEDLKPKLKLNTWRTKDVIFQKKLIPYFKDKLHITKSYQYINGEDIITDPKTEKSRRDVVIPDFLVEELRQFIGMLYGYGRDDRIFQITKSYLHHEMSRGAKAAGVKRIRIHDLRHSHISLLIRLGFSAVAIGNRVGHESQTITFHYAHMFPTEQIEMADKLNEEFMPGTGNGGDVQ